MSPVAVIVAIVAYIYVAVCFGNLVAVTITPKSKIDMLDFGLRLIRTTFGAFSTHLGAKCLSESNKLLRSIHIGPRSKQRTFLGIVVPLYAIVQMINMFQVSSVMPTE